MTETTPTERLDDTLEVTENRVACDGGSRVFGHPRVWYDLSEAGTAVCGYCGRRFVKRSGA